MKRFVKIAVIALAGGMLALQIFQIDTTPLPDSGSGTLGSIVDVPPPVETILARSCKDCHSNETRYPWYAHVQPAGWLLQQHIESGRERLNLSKFGEYTERTRLKKLEQMCDEVQAREMPLPSYLWLHRDAVLSEADIQTICDWSNSARTAMGAK